MNNNIILARLIVPIHTWMQKVQPSAIIILPDRLVAENMRPELDGRLFRKEFAAHGVINLSFDPV